METELEMDDQLDMTSDSDGSSASNGRTWEGGGFEVQEIEGVGGVVKKKVKRIVSVGRWVEEFEDEKDGLSAEGRVRVLEREIEGRNRSWCGWCDRVIPSVEDWEELAR